MTASRKAKNKTEAFKQTSRNEKKTKQKDTK